MNHPDNRTDFRVFRHTDNEIDFLIKNFDRRIVPVSNGSLVVHIMDSKSSRVLLTRPLTIVDASKGWARLFLTGVEVGDLPIETLIYAVVWTRADGVQVPCYTDRDRRCSGYIHVENGPIPAPAEPLYLATDDFTPISGRLVSGALAGAATSGNQTGQHSLMLRFNDFSGEVLIQGSLVRQPSSTAMDWFDVRKETFSRKTGNHHMAFEGNLIWVRISVKKDDGTIDLIQFRN